MKFRSETMPNKLPETIDVPVWVKKGNRLVNRSCLELDDPDHTYHYIKNALGLEPEDYGVFLKREE